MIWQMCTASLPFNLQLSVIITNGLKVKVVHNCRLSIGLTAHRQPATKANSAFHPSGVGKWEPASAGNAKTGMVHYVSGWTQGVQVKLWDHLRTRAIPERLRGVTIHSSLHWLGNKSIRFRWHLTVSCGETDTNQSQHSSARSSAWLRHVHRMLAGMVA